MASPQAEPLRKLQSDNQVQLLSAMNKLRGLGLQRHLKLPQIVICGSTSSGKSSILQALSGVRFPVASTICTRFATELVLEPSTQASATYSILPRPNAPADLATRLNDFRGSFVLDDVSQVIDKAKVEMGIDQNNKISYDILRLEVYGPGLPKLTLIDLPGLVQFAEDNTEPEQIAGLAKRYLKAKNSIILAVVSAKDALNNQGVLALARECDADKERTMGIITKPDQLKGDRELLDEFLRLAKNEHPAFRLSRPWNVIRNRKPDEPSDSFDRESVERELFAQAPWTDLPSSQLGLDALRTNLCDWQLSHIIQSLPGVIKTIEEEIRKAQKQLDDLGETRDSREDRKGYLLKISQQYYGLVIAALAENIPRAESDEEHEVMQIATNVRGLMDEFDLTMRERGHVHELARADLPLKQINRQDTRQTVSVTKEQWLLEVNRERKKAIGKALPGLFNPGLVAVLFRKESRKWKDIAHEYIDKVCVVTRQFLHKLMLSICSPGSDTASLILRNIIMPSLGEMKLEIEQKTTELLTPYTVLSPYATRQRFAASLHEVQAEDLKRESVHFGIARTTSSHPDAEANSKLLESTRAYYKIAMENFIDNMATLGIENCILQKLPYLFDPALVSKLSDEKIQLLGGETQKTISRRAYLDDYLDKLRTARETCDNNISAEFYTAQQDHDDLLPPKDSSSLSNGPSQGEDGHPTSGGPSAPRADQSTIPTSFTGHPTPTSDTQPPVEVKQARTQSGSPENPESSDSLPHHSALTHSTPDNRPTTPSSSAAYENTPRSATNQDNSLPGRTSTLHPPQHNTPSSSRLSPSRRSGHNRSPSFAELRAERRAGSVSPRPSRENTDGSTGESQEEQEEEEL